MTDLQKFVTKEKNERNFLFKSIIGTVTILLMLCTVLMICMSISLSWFITNKDQGVGSMGTVVKGFKGEVDTTVMFNRESGHVADASGIVFLPGDFLTYKIDIIEVNDDILAVNVLLQGLYGDSLPIPKPGSSNYTMFDMYSVAVYNNTSGAFGPPVPISDGGAAQGGRLYITTAVRAAGVPFASIIFRIIFSPPAAIDLDNINKLQGKEFSFDSILLTDSLLSNS